MRTAAQVQSLLNLRSSSSCGIVSRWLTHASSACLDLGETVGSPLCIRMPNLLIRVFVNTAKNIWFLMIVGFLIMTASYAHADIVNFTLVNVILADGAEITGTFDWTYNDGEFEGGNGTFTALEIPYTIYSFSDGNLNTVIEANSIEISGNGNYHDVGLDIKLKFPSQPFTPNQSTSIDLGLSFFECCGNGFKDQPFRSGSITPTILVPEPSAFHFFLSGLALFGFIIRRSAWLAH